MSEKIEIDLQELALARRDAHRRTPEGRRMGLFRWAERKGAVWLFPSSFINDQGLVAMAHESRWQVGEIAEPIRFGYWLATAARQDLWRALQGVPGLLPVIRVRPDPEARAVAMLAGALTTPARAGHAIEAVLGDIFQPNRLNAWTDWAQRKAAEPLPPSPYGEGSPLLPERG